MSQELNARDIVLSSIPKTLDELKAMPESDLKDPYKVVALLICSLNRYAKSKEDCYAMIDYLMGPRDLSNYDKQFIRERMMDGNDYIPRSYFKGSVTGNNYTPLQPLTVHLFENIYSNQEPNFKVVYVYSGGADSPRSVKLRFKPSTEQWFVWEQFLLVGIREPKSLDVWL